MLENDFIMKKLLISIVLIGVLAYTSIAQEGQFSVAVSTDSLLMGNALEVTFSLKNVKGEQFEAPTFEGFEIVGGPNQSSSFQMVNGDVTQEMSYTYYLQPLDEGTFFIPPASIKTETGYLETQPLEVVVYPNPDGIIQEPNKPRSDFHFFDFPRTKQVPPATQKPKKKRKIYKL